MSITAAFVMFSVTWFLVLLMVLPIRFESQADAGRVEPGTPRSAPADLKMGPKLRVTTIVTAMLFAVMYGIITSGWITIRDLDVRGTMGPAPVQPAD